MSYTLPIEKHEPISSTYLGKCLYRFRPFWAQWPFETLVLSRRYRGHLGEMTLEELRAYASIMKHLTIKYDNLSHTSFPYSAGLHQIPTDGEPHPEGDFHLQP